MARVYGALNPDQLDELACGRSVGLDPARRAPEGLVGDALEEAEYDALVEAAADAADGASGRRRVVVAGEADVAAGASGVVHLAPRQVASFHVDETLEHRDEDLLWYDVSEIDEVRTLLAGR